MEKAELKTATITSTLKTYFCNVTLYIITILCINEISFPFIVLYFENFLPGISCVTRINWISPSWPKHVVKYTKSLMTYGLLKHAVLHVLSKRDIYSKVYFTFLLCTIIKEQLKKISNTRWVKSRYTVFSIVLMVYTYFWSTLYYPA